MYPRLNYNPKNYRINSIDGGIVIDKSEEKIPYNKSPDMLNMYFSGNLLKKREGQLMLFYEDDIYSVSKDVFYNHFIYHAGDKIKAYNCDTKEVKVLIGKVKEKKGTFFLYNGKIYYIGTGEYYVISSKDEELNCSVVSGYIPTVLINCNEQSVGDSFEPYNYLTATFKYTYNTSNATHTIKLPDIQLDTEKGIYAMFDGRVLYDYTIDYDNGYLTFQTALSEGHNLLEITYFGKDLSDRNKITNCKIAETFGGLSSGISEGTRMFLSGNKDFSNTFFYSELKNPEYFPINQFEIIGDDNDPVMCIGKQYNGLVFFKKKSIYISYYNFDGNEVNFTLSRLNSNVGCDCPYTLETVDNQLVWVNSTWGVMTLSSTNIKDEKNVRCISQNINGISSKKALLMQENLQEAVAFINRGKFYIVTGRYTYVLDISTNFSINLNGESLSWYLMDNIKANDYLYYNREVYLAGDRGISYFKNVLYDFNPDTPINAYVKTKAIDFGCPEIFKTIYDISFSQKAINNSYFKLSLSDENGKMGKVSEYFINKFNFINFSFSHFTFLDNIFSFVFKRRISRSRTKYLMIELSNDKPNSQMTLSDINITYSTERSAKFNGI